MKQPTVFFGASSFVLPVIEFLNRDYDLKLVITTEMKSSDAVPKFCQENNIPFIQVNSPKELLNTKYQILHTESQFAILADFGLIVSQEIINMFPKGIINIHPSRLPQYRGPTPGQTAILLGDVRTGVSIILLDKEVDHGPLLGQEEEEILAHDTATSLYNRLFAKGVALLQVVLPAYLSGELKPIEQDHSKATFTKILTRESGYIDSDHPTSPGLLDRTIRAYYPWPGVWTKWHMENEKEKIVKFLPNKIIQVEGKKPMSYKDFMNGYPEGRKFLEKLQLI
jgi:methionyl-tRNA formyltransferase